MTKQVPIAIIGSADPPADDSSAAEVAAEWLARTGATIVCGGMGGIMAAASRGAKRAGGLTIGLLPGGDPAAANEWIDLPLTTGLGDARNILVARVARGVLAFPGHYGTLSELSFARLSGLPVVTCRMPLDDPDIPNHDDPLVAARTLWAIVCR